MKKKNKQNKIYCKKCGELMSFVIVPVQKFELKNNERLFYHFNTDTEEVIKKTAQGIMIQENELFDEYTGKRIFRKIIYCSKGCLSYIAEIGIKKKLLEHGLIKDYGNSVYSWAISS